MYSAKVRIVGRFFLAVFFLFVVSLSCAHAEFLQLKEKAIRMEKIGGTKTIFDNLDAQRKGTAFPGIDHDEKGHLKKFWLFAGAGPIDSGYLGTKIEQARLSLFGIIVDEIGGTQYDECTTAMRGINYQDFILTGNVPEGTKVKCKLLVDNQCYGYVNAARYAGAQTRYYLKFDSGLLLDKYIDDWEKPALGKTIFFKTDDPNPPDAWSRDLGQKIQTEAAKQLISQATDIALDAIGAATASATVIGIAVDELVNAIEGLIETNKYVDDKYKFEFSFSGNKIIEYKDVWFTVSTREKPYVYRVYNTLEGKLIAQANPRMQDGESAAVYIDFFNHQPHWGDDEGKIIPNRGFGIKDIYLSADPSSIIFPRGYRYPVIDVASLAIVNFDKPVLLGKPTPVQVRFVVSNKAGFTKPCKVYVEAPEHDKSFTMTIDKEYGSEYDYTFDYVFTKPGDHVFRFTIDPDHELDPYMDLTHDQSMVVRVAGEPDLKAEFTSITGDYEINKAMDIRARVTNIGTEPSAATTLDIWAGNEKIKQQKIKVLTPRQYEDVTVSWTPKKEGPVDIACEVDFDGKVREYDDKNNGERQQITIELPQHQWFVKEKSLICVPDKPQAGETAKIYFTVKNKGRTADTLSYDVLIDDKVVRHGIVTVAPGQAQTVGDTAQDEISWKVTGGKHVVKVVLDPMYSYSDFERTQAVEELVITPNLPMPSVEGVDLLIQRGDVHSEGGKINFRVYNRGTKPTTVGSVKVLRYRSGKEKPEEALNLSRYFAPLSYENFYFDLEPNCKYEITVDPNNYVVEADENNNVFSFENGNYVAYQPPPPSERESVPDLVVAQIINLDYPVKMNESREITIVVGNLNEVEVPHVRVGYSIRNLGFDDMLPAHGFIQGEEKFPVIGKERQASFGFKYQAVCPGNYELRVVVETDSSVPERNLSNNRLTKSFSVAGDMTAAAFFSGKEVDLSLEPDMVVSNSEPAVGEPVSFAAKVHNNSAIDVWGADIDMFINDKLEEGYPLGTMEAGSVKDMGFSHVFDVAGDYTVKIKADAKNAVPETDENNNTVSLALHVKPGILGSGHCDVAVTSFTLSKTSCLQGEPVTASATVKNTGQDTVRAVLFTMSVGEENVRHFYVKVIPILSAGEEATFSTTLPVPIAGEHILFARLDGKDIIKEENEDNNVLSATLTVEPITAEKLKSKATDAVLNKANKAIEVIDGWLRGLGKPK